MIHQRKTVIGLIFLSILISACGEVAAAPLTRLEPCTPEKNSYEDLIDSELVKAYDDGVRSISNPGEYNKFQQKAFNELVNRVYDWTDYVVINTGDKNIDILITHIRSELAHLIIINHYLYKKNNNFTGRLDEQVKNDLSGIIERNEDIFFIMFIAPPSTDNVTIEFPLSEVELTNTSGLTVSREHDDHNLEKPILLQGEPEYGFFFFPMAVVKDGSCRTVIDEKRDTSIVISVPRITINGTRYGIQSWKFKYAPLIDVSSLSPVSLNEITPAQPADPMTPKMIPLSAGGEKDESFWVSLARIIWLETTLDP